MNVFTIYFIIAIVTFSFFLWWLPHKFLGPKNKVPSGVGGPVSVFMTALIAGIIWPIILLFTIAFWIIDRLKISDC